MSRNYALLPRVSFGRSISCSRISIPRTLSSYFKMSPTLEQQILAHYYKNRISKQERIAKLELTKEMYEALKANFRNDILLFTVGSTVTKLGTNYCDLDLCLVVEPIKKYGNDAESLKFLAQLQKILANFYSQRCEAVDVIPSKTISVIRMKVVSFKGITCDIDISLNNITGIRNSHLLHYYSLIDKRFSVLVMVIKEWATKADIADFRSGTFSGYCLALLVLFFLQCGVDPPVLPSLQSEMPRLFNADVPVKELRFFADLKRPLNKNPNKQSLSELLIEFFDFYTHRVNFQRDVLSISCAMKKLRDEHVFANKRRQSYIFIEELYDPSKNAAKRICDINCYEKIIRAFHEALEQLKSKQPNLSLIGVRD